METTKTIMPVLKSPEVQQSNVEKKEIDISVSAANELVKVDVENILNLESMESFIDGLNTSKKLGYKLGTKEGFLIKDQMNYVLGGLRSYKEGNVERKAINNNSFTGAPNLEPKVLGGYANVA